MSEKYKEASTPFPKEKTDKLRHEKVTLPKSARDTHKADSYYSLGIKQNQSGDYKSALQSHQHALNIRKDLLGEKNLETADSYYSLGITQYELGDFTSALQSQQCALIIRKKLLGDQHTKTADSYYSLAHSQYEFGDYKSALQSYQRALNIRKNLLGEQHAHTADIYYLLGNIQYELGDYSSAQQLDQCALNIRKNLLGEQHTDTANSYFSLGITQYQLGDFVSALQSHQCALNIRKNLLSEQHAHTADSYYSLGNTQRQLGDNTSALQSLQCALNIRKKLLSEQHIDTADSYHSLGITQYQLGEFTSALQSHQCALNISKNLLGETHIDTADSYYSLGNTQYELGDFISALQSHQCALNIRKKLLDEKHAHTANSYYSLGITQYQLGEFTSALQSHKCALNIRKNLLGEQHLDTADSYFSLGITRFELGDFTSALQSHQCGLNIRKNLLGEQHSHTASSYYSLGITQYQLADYTSALHSHQCALNIRKNLLGERHTDTARSYYTLRITQNQLGHTTSDTEYVGVVSSNGEIVGDEGAYVTFLPGAVDTSDDPLTVRMTLEEPAKHYGPIVENGLENDVIFAAPIIKLQPHGQVFKKPVTITTKMKNVPDNFKGNFVVLHGIQNREGKIVWDDITHNSTLDMKEKEVEVEIDTFSFIAVLWRLTSISTKEIATRFNLLSFNYTLTVLFGTNSPNSSEGELALVFMSQDVYHEKSYREHDASTLMQLKRNGFEELCSMEGQESSNIYNNENLNVSIVLGTDYQMRDKQQRSIGIKVDSSVWWSTGHLVKLPLQGTGDVRILCGNIAVQGQYGHTREDHFCQLDLCGYVRRLLRIDGDVANFMPVAKKLGMPDEDLNQVVTCWKSEDEQLNIILKHWREKNSDIKDPAVIKKALEQLKPEDYLVKERGKMHIRHLRKLAIKILGLKHDDPHLMRFLANESKVLCTSVLRDCCIEMAGSKAEVETASSAENPADLLKIQQRVSQDFVHKYEQICSSMSPETTRIGNFLLIQLDLIQAIKDIFCGKTIAEVQSGLRGLPKEILDQSTDSIRKAAESRTIFKVVSEVCRVLEKLCLKNCGSQSTDEIHSWGNSAALLILVDFLKVFFQSCEELKLCKRLKLFLNTLRDIMSDPSTVDDICFRDFFNLSLSVLSFAEFSPSKLVRFEVTSQSLSSPSCSSETMKYDEDQNTFSQKFQLVKETEDDLVLDATAHVHINGRIHDVGAFKSVVMLPASQKDAFDRASIPTLPVVVHKVKETIEGSETLQITFYSTQKTNVANALSLLKKEIGEDAVDWKQTYVTQSPLAVRSFAEAGTVVRLRLVYKWQSDAIILDSRDFVALAESSAGGAYALDLHTEVENVTAEASSPLETQLAALSLVPNTASSDGNFVMDPTAVEMIQKHAQQQCGPIVIHFHQIQNILKGEVCVAGEKTTLNVQAPSTDQRSLEQGPSTAPLQSITAGTSSHE